VWFCLLVAGWGTIIVFHYNKKIFFNALIPHCLKIGVTDIQKTDKKNEERDAYGDSLARLDFVSKLGSLTT